MLEFIGLAAGLLSISAYIPYIRDIFKGDARPERASWLIWLVLTGIAFFSQMAKGATSSLWLSGLETIGLGVVCVLSIKYGVGGLTKRDLLALLGAGAGLFLWYFTKNPALALYIIIAVDSIGTLLTIEKAYKDPYSETLTLWILVAIAGALSMISVGKFDVILLSYPLYIFLANIAIPVAILLGRKKKKRKKK